MKMRKIFESFYKFFFVAFILCNVVASVAASQLVLCVHEDGHFSIEFAAQEHHSAANQLHVETHEHNNWVIADDSENQCGPCTDVPLFFSDAGETKTNIHKTGLVKNLNSLGLVGLSKSQFAFNLYAQELKVKKLESISFSNNLIALKTVRILV